jgi:hypothetical protein
MLYIAQFCLAFVFLFCVVIICKKTRSPGSMLLNRRDSLKPTLAIFGLLCLYLLITWTIQGFDSRNLFGIVNLDMAEPYFSVFLVVICGGAFAFLCKTFFFEKRWQKWLYGGIEILFAVSVVLLTATTIVSDGAKHNPSADKAIRMFSSIIMGTYMVVRGLDNATNSKKG